MDAASLDVLTEVLQKHGLTEVVFAAERVIDVAKEEVPVIRGGGGWGTLWGVVAYRLGINWLAL